MVLDHFSATPFKLASRPQPVVLILDRHKLQSLDVAYYNQQVQTWLLANGRAVTEFDIAGLFAPAYSKGATLGNT